MMGDRDKRLVLAGFRSGWAASSLQLADALETAGPPPNVGSDAERITAWRTVIDSIRQSATRPPRVLVGERGDLPDDFAGEPIFKDLVVHGGPEDGGPKS